MKLALPVLICSALALAIAPAASDGGAQDSLMKGFLPIIHDIIGIVPTTIMALLAWRAAKAAAKAAADAGSVASKTSVQVTNIASDIDGKMKQLLTITDLKARAEEKLEGHKVVAAADDKEKLMEAIKAAALAEGELKAIKEAPPVVGEPPK